MEAIQLFKFRKKRNISDEEAASIARQIAREALQNQLKYPHEEYLSVVVGDIPEIYNISSYLE